MGKIICGFVLLALIGAAEAGQFSLATQDTPLGHRLGVHDDPDRKDKFLVLTVGIRNLYTFTGYFQVV